jgi:predicted dehydrogenase
MEQSKVKFAIVGLNNFGRTHAKGIAENKDTAELAAVCDIDEKILEERADAFGVERRYTDFYKMLEDGGFDCVILATPDQIHAEHAVAACEKGYHVLCEKPLAQSLEDCKAMADAVRRTGVKFMTGQVSRKNHANVKLKEIVDSGILGEIFYFESEYSHDYQYLDPAWRKDPVKLRHGIIGGGCHAIELMRWMVGNPTKVSAFSNQKVLTDWPVYDSTIAIMEFPNGAIGKIFCSIGGKLPNMMPTAVYGTKGTAKIHDNHTGEIHVYRHVVADNGEHMYPEQIYTYVPKGHNTGAEIAEMVDCILNDKQPECDVFEGSKVVSIGIAAIESSRLGGVPIAPDYIEK